MGEECVLTPQPLCHPFKCWKNFQQNQSCEGKKEVFSDRHYIPGEMLPNPQLPP